MTTKQQALDEFKEEARRLMAEYQEAIRPLDSIYNDQEAALRALQRVQEPL